MEQYSYDTMEVSNATASNGMSDMISLAIWVAVLVGAWKVFEKAGQKGWAALIPIYNLVVLMRIIGRPAWWVLLVFIPLVNLVVLVIISLDLAKAFGKSSLFGIVGLFLFSPVGYLMLGFGDAKYKKLAAAKKK